MDIATYVLLTRNASGELVLAESRKDQSELPVGFEPRYADFLFEFAESRVKCQDNDKIMLATGIVNTDEIDRAPDFIEAFKEKLRDGYDFSQWQIIRTKEALSTRDSVYKTKLLNRLKARHTSNIYEYPKDKAVGSDG